MIKSAERGGHIHGIKVCRRAPIITHLLFVDDSFLFMRANDGEVGYVKNLLHRYELASRQSINFKKSSMFFSGNIQQGVRDRLAGLLGHPRKSGGWEIAM